MCPKGADGMANSVDPDQIEEQSYLGLHCLPTTHPTENLGTLRYNFSSYLNISIKINFSKIIKS